MEQSQLPTFNWSGYDWISQERWGQIHPSKSHWWYDPTKVHIDDEGLLHLQTGYNPKYFEHLGRTANIGAGLISCTSQFSFGTFTLKAKLPYGKHLWPSFWMWSWSDWPPEIDVFEGFSDFSDTYESLKYPVKALSLFQKLFKRPVSKELMVKSNLHFKTSEQEHIALTTLYPDRDRNFKTSRDLTSAFYTYKLIWTPVSIEIRYEDTLMLYLHKDMNSVAAEILQQFSQHKMNVVINNGVTSFVNVQSPPISDFVLYSFNYQPYISI